MPNNQNYLDLSETKAWNIARPYSEIKILKWLVLADEYEMLATFGTSSLIEELATDEYTKQVIRLRSLRWLNKVLIMVVNNTLKLLKPKEIPKMRSIKNYLTSTNIMIKELIDDSKITKRDGGSIFKIDEEKFDNILFILSEIKCEMNEPLTKSDLIFTSSEEFDPNKIKEELKKRLIEVG